MFDKKWNIIKINYYINNEKKTFLLVNQNTQYVDCELRRNRVNFFTLLD